MVGQPLVAVVDPEPTSAEPWRSCHELAASKTQDRPVAMTAPADRVAPSAGVLMLIITVGELVLELEPGLVLLGVLGGGVVCGAGGFVVGRGVDDGGEGAGGTRLVLLVDGDGTVVVVGDVVAGAEVAPDDGVGAAVLVVLVDWSGLLVGRLGSGLVVPIAGGGVWLRSWVRPHAPPAMMATDAAAARGASHFEERSAPGRADLP